MNKEEAKQLVGKLVVCWTAFNGSYIGECLSIESEPRRPWRAVVRILAVAEFPVQGLRNGGGPFVKRKPFEFGAIKDFGNSSAKLFEGERCPDYHESVVNALQVAIQGAERGIEHARQANFPYSIEIRSLEALKEYMSMLSGGNHNVRR